MPWAAASAAAGGLLVGLAGGGLKGGLLFGLIGLVFAAFAASAAVARCPACGGPLGRLARERPDPVGRPGPADRERERRCPHCGARFE